MALIASEPNTTHDKDARIKALLAEFQFLRTEIEWLIANGMRYQQFAIVITAAGLSASTFTISQRPDFYPGLAAAVASVLAYLGILYYWEHVEIHVVAGYLQQVVREKLRSITGLEAWWEWEEYKGRQWKEKFGSPNIFGARLLAFLVISVLFLATALWAGWTRLFAIAAEPEGLTGAHRLVGVTTLILWALGLYLTVRLACLRFFRSNLSEYLLDVPQLNAPSWPFLYRVRSGYNRRDTTA